MELDELRHAWQVLGRQLEQQGALQRELLRERRLDRMRRGLRPLFWAQLAQGALGLGLILLGVSCWTSHLGVPAMLATGLLVHAFGVVTLLMALITTVLVARIDYAAPVARIQQQLAQLRCVYRINSNVCGLPWWIFWVFVVLAFADVKPGQGTPAWVLVTLLIGGIGLLATAGFIAWRRRSGRGPGALADESAGIRRGERVLEELADGQE
ncbi:hypothetical protein E5843_14375 [Luteimonas yindakuii]|uniref:hypothetical protein n=1 Tax=Luteimonas yindakuii TaxID=2565782 RepID=UPI0011077540|nr:hypothetical protein [Luteimonas yindakuii]QCU72452.1 hypothetical protein E5843_14375 [Luteimonas yindakuii]